VRGHHAPVTSYVCSLYQMRASFTKAVISLSVEVKNV